MTINFREVKKSMQWGNTTIEISTGKIARQASSCVVRIGDTVVLCTAVAEKSPKSGIDFFPLTVHYLERFYAVGSIPGGFFKRESKPSDRETLTSRLIDRPIRPMFPQGYRNEVQVVCQVLSFDKENESDIAALIGTSAALTISGAPMLEPIAAARVGYIDGQFILNPSISQMPDSKLDLVVAGTESSVLMVESEAKQLPEDVMLEAVMFGHRNFQPIIAMIKEFASEVGVFTQSIESNDNTTLLQLVQQNFGAKITSAYGIQEKSGRRLALKALSDEAVAESTSYTADEVLFAIKTLEKDIVRSNILDHGVRLDGRKLDQVRPIACEIDLLPKTHGSALFTRGETQALVVTTLGTGMDEQTIDDISGNRSLKFFLHYNFPPYSVGETGRMGPPGRRELGHGKLAYRAISSLLPDPSTFPYTIRVVSEITESNGSSSMATVCGTSLSLMSCGVALAAPVSGIAMGLIKKGDKYAVLSDIMGDEDHLGDMDFKVAGTAAGITALQMDIKINGISEEIMSVALAQAKTGRLHILDKMAEVIQESRSDVNDNAPKITTIKIDKDKIREVIGAGGKIIKDICEKSQAKVDISDDGTIKVAAANSERAEIALSMIRDIIAVPEVGKIYTGTVMKITDFGAFVRYLGTSEGLVHISEIVEQKLNKVTDVMREGEVVTVKLLGVERNGKVRLSMKGLNIELVETYNSNHNSTHTTINVKTSTESGEEPSPEKAARFQRKRSSDKRAGAGAGAGAHKERSGPKEVSREQVASEEPAKKKRRLF